MLTVLCHHMICRLLANQSPFFISSLSQNPQSFNPISFLFTYQRFWFSNSRPKHNILISFFTGATCLWNPRHIMELERSPRHLFSFFTHVAMHTDFDFDELIHTYIYIYTLKARCHLSDYKKSSLCFRHYFPPFSSSLKKTYFIDLDYNSIFTFNLFSLFLFIV